MAIQVKCPSCKAVLKLPSALAPGKKIRCPECEHVFAPTAAAKPAAKPAAKAVAVPPPTAKSSPSQNDDDDGEGSYGLEGEKALSEKDKKNLEINFGELRDKFPKSKRGPAIAKLVKPANFLLGEGMLIGILALIGFIAMVFPLVFTEGKPVTDAKMKEQFTYMGGFVLLGLWGALICLGASKMQNLESYAWAMTGSIMGLVLLVGIYGVMALSDPEVKAGFNEEPPKD